MTRQLMLGLILGSALLFLFLIGCGSDKTSTSPEQTTNVQIQAVTPADGSTSVSTSAPVCIKFTDPVDTSSISHNFHFSGGDGMHAWRDSLEHFGGFGMMGMGNSAHMMNWMDSIEIEGEFHWNAALDSCAFIPDSSMSPATDYLCLLYEGGMRGNDGGMMGGSHHDDSGYHMFQFRTVSAAGSPTILSVLPMDGADNVPGNSNVMLAFDMPMDSLSVMLNFHLAGGDGMHEWMDSLQHHRGMGGMGMVDMEHMILWLDSIQVSGIFQWNDAMDSCVFMPDSTLMPGTDYMIYLYRDVHSETGDMMDTHHMDYDGFMFDFMTEP